MKLFLKILVVTLSFSSTLSADEPNRGLGKVKVMEVKYLSAGIFLVTLSMTSTHKDSPQPMFFNNEPTLSFEFHPDNLNGTSVIATPNQEITRMDIGLTGPSLINLLVSKMGSGESIDLSCGFTQIASGNAIRSGQYVLNYFQVNYDR